MTFYLPNSRMQTTLIKLIEQFAKDGRPGLQNSISITWVRYEQSNPEPSIGIGAGWSEKKLIYPASVVKLFYAIAAEAWVQKNLLPESIELVEAIQDMIIDSSNDATSLVMDFLSGTTSGPSLPKEKFEQWKKQRNLINEWLKNLKWAETEGANCCQKTWNDGPYGREKDFYGQGRANQNQLSTNATGKMMEAIMTDSIVSPPSCKKLKTFLYRSLDMAKRRAEPENQIDGFLGEGFAQGTRLWSKAGWMSTSRHDVTWSVHGKGNPMLLVIFCQGRQLANDPILLPALGNELQKFHLEDREIN